MRRSFPGIISVGLASGGDRRVNMVIPKITKTTWELGQVHVGFERNITLSYDMGIIQFK